MERRQYLDRVVKRLKAILDAETRLPCKFVIAGGWAAQTDGPIVISIDPEAHYDKVFEGSDLFGDIQRRLNEEFSKDPWYIGIQIDVPHHFLGKRHLEQRRQQEEFIETYRRSRFHGRRRKKEDGKP